MYSIVNTYTFDHRTGLPKGQSNTMLYLTEVGAEDNSQEAPDKNTTNKPDESIKTSNAKIEPSDHKSGELNANTKGK